MTTDTSAGSELTTTAIAEALAAADREVDAAGAVAPPRSRRRAAALDPTIRRDLRRIVTLIALTPLLFVLANETPRLLDDPLATAYGALVLSVTIALLYIAYAHYDDPSMQEVAHRPRDVSGFPELPAEPQVSMLLAVHNETEAIAECVRSIVNSDYPRLDLIVVDDASTDDTAAILDELAADLGFTVIHLEENVGKKQALVRACELAGGDVIAFTDSDCLLAEDALRRCVEALVRPPGTRRRQRSRPGLQRHRDAADPGPGRLVRRPVPGGQGSRGDLRHGDLRVRTAGGVPAGGDLQLPAGVGGRPVPRWRVPLRDRPAADRVRARAEMGRPEAQGQARRFAVREHVDYPARAWRVGYVQSARVWTQVPARMRTFLRQQVRWKKSFVRNLFFTGRFMWRRGTGPALMFYGHALWVVVAPFMAVRHLIWAPLHGLWLLSLLYLAGILLKGTAWAVAVKVDNPGSTVWRYRPLMSLISATVLSWLLPYAIVTIRRGTWSRGVG